VRSSIIALLALLTAAHASAQEDPFAAITDADPMELARAVDRLGDDAVLSRLSAGPREVRLAAMRASPFMAGPELALEPLAATAAGRDPLLAPAAASAALTILRSLDLDGLRRREVDPRSLSGARGLFEALSTDRSARADLRAAAAIVVSLLDQLGA
jgi:hypothetical protein